jgi:hypothetical protein
VIDPSVLAHQRSVLAGEAKPRKAAVELRRPRKTAARPCSVPYCERPAHRGDLCGRHWWQVRHHGIARSNLLRVASPKTIETARARLAARGIPA